MPDRFRLGGQMVTDWEGARVRPNRRHLVRVLWYFSAYWRRGLVVIACVTAGAGLGLVPALITKSVLDYLAGLGGGVGPLAVLITAGVLASIAGGLISLLQAYLSTTVSQDVMVRLRAELFGSLLHQSVGFYISARNGELLSRMDNDVGGIQNIVSETILGVTTSLVVAGSTLAVMFTLDWRLTLGALVASVFPQER